MVMHSGLYNCMCPPFSSHGVGGGGGLYFLDSYWSTRIHMHNAHSHSIIMQLGCATYSVLHYILCSNYSIIGTNLYSFYMQPLAREEPPGKDSLLPTIILPSCNSMLLNCVGLSCSHPQHNYMYILL